jgi:antitoxin (DNA-binding transcriptional repressor) of toxin-antitoxin stability system
VIEDRMTVRIAEAELARDIHSVLARVQEGVGIVIEQDHRPAAVIKSPSALPHSKQAVRTPSLTKNSPETWKKESRPTASRGILHPGNRARFERPGCRVSFSMN